MKILSPAAYAIRGLWLFRSEPRLRKWVAIPLAMGFAALVPWLFLSADVYAWIRGLLPAFLPPEAAAEACAGFRACAAEHLGAIGNALLRAGTTLVALFLTLCSGLLLLVGTVKVLGATFNDRLSEATERIALGKEEAVPPPAGFVRATLHALRVTLVQFLCMALVFVPLYALSVALPGAGAVAVSGLLVLASAFWLSYDAMSYSMDRRLMPFRSRLALMARHPWKTLVFGFEGYLFLLVPAVNVFMFPFLVTGGTLLLMDLRGETAPKASGAEEAETGLSAAREESTPAAEDRDPPPAE